MEYCGDEAALGPNPRESFMSDVVQKAEGLSEKGEEGLLGGLRRGEGPLALQSN